MSDYIGPLSVCLFILVPALLGWLYDATHQRREGWLPPLTVQPPGDCNRKCRCDHE